MKWPDIDWKDALKTIAPTVASIFGTPLAGAGVSVLLDAIFPDDDNKSLSQQQAEDKLATAVRCGLTPEQYAAAQQADLAFKQRCIDAGIRLEEITAADVANARARDIAIISAGRSNTRANVMLAGATVALIGTAGTLVFSHQLGLSEAGQIVGCLIMIIGQTVQFIGQAFAFEFGSSRGGERSKSLLANVIGDRK